MSKRLQEKIETLGSSISNLANLARNQQDQIIRLNEEMRQTRHAMETVVAWVGEELGPEAINRLNKAIAAQSGEEPSGIILPN